MRSCLRQAQFIQETKAPIEDPGDVRHRLIELYFGQGGLEILRCLHRRTTSPLHHISVPFMRPCYSRERRMGKSFKSEMVSEWLCEGFSQPLTAQLPYAAIHALSANV
ncbi:hypothetical protein TZ53_06340 [Sphingobium sp. YBL2]|nr:hypothetical protein TZ53_06340 [Sphingobium sp. YBL2]